MNKILLIETTAEVCSVALMENGNLILENESEELRTHSKNLTLQIEQVLKETETTFSTLDAIAVSKGPGSYTGLRIGVSTAKGLCYALNIPLISVSTLHAMTFSSIIDENNYDETALLCPMLDARRMEVYCSVYDMQRSEITPVEAKIIDENSFAETLNNHTILFFGTGANKCENVILHPNAQFINNIYPKASQLCALAQKAYVESNFEDLAYFEPFYLKDFIATTPKQKVI